MRGKCQNCGGKLRGCRRVYCSDRCRWACIAVRKKIRRELRRTVVDDESDGVFQAYMPTPEEIRRAAAEVRANWSEAERERRVVVKSMLVEIQQFPDAPY